MEIVSYGDYDFNESSGSEELYGVDTFSPLPQVGSLVGLLTTTPTVLDSATKVGCKSQSYTSWDYMSRLYVGGVFVSDAAEQPQVRVTREDGEKWDKSTKQKLADMYPAQRILLEKGLKVFIRGKGVMSRAQAAKMRLEQ
ncbi:e3 ubiquitin-protein ligase [Lasius niger]|uniref:E3 ubiquitin-protein ligase n=1 Tax=Lasius niger TaxID=67767 RepID=A0A0J7K2L7_LASNI|nr:e3 ubiquitin-protein ligase [Lasius niger]